MTGYLDTSVLLRLLLNEPYKKIDLSPFTQLISSELIEIEARRRLNNMRLNGELGDSDVALFSEKLFSILEAVDQILLTRPILTRAKLSTGVRIRSLDYIHLCSALVWKDTEKRDVTILSHDIELGRAAQTMGFPVLGATEDFRA